MKSVAVIGVGLIGGSFALALRQAGFSGEILGVSSQRSIGSAASRGIIDRGVTLQEAAERCDLLYLSQPIEQILRTIEQLGPLVRPGCLITDAGSTKQRIVEHAARFLGATDFLGGHPLAGKEQRGTEHADGDLFRDRPYILTSAKDSARQAVLRDWLKRIGARVIEMTPFEHDQTIALTSHLPQLLATALASTLAGAKNSNTDLAFGPGLLDMTRLAMSAPEIWASIVATNREPIAEALKSFKVALCEVEGTLASGDIEQVFEKAGLYARRIRGLEL